MTVLVTGAAGHVGRELVEACEARGLRVRLAGRDPGALAARWPGREVVLLDYRDAGSWGPAVAGCTGLFLLRPPAIADVGATLVPFVERARAQGVAHVVFLSVAGAERMSWVPHREVERRLEADGRPWTILRPGFFAQNLEDAYRRDLVEDGRLYVPAGRGRVAFLDVRDAAEVAAVALADPARFAGHHLTLTGPEALGFEDVARALAARLERPIRYVPASLPGYVWHLRRRRGLPWSQVAVQTILHLGLRRGDAEAVDGTVARVLGRPATPLEAYLARAADTWRRPAPGR